MGQNSTDLSKIGNARSVLTDGGSVPIGLAVEDTNRHDCKMVRETCTSIPIACPTPSSEPTQGMCQDQDDDDDEGRERLAEFGLTADSRARGKAATTLTQEAGCTARRWGMGRTHRGRHRCRRVLIRRDKPTHHHLALVHVACASMTDRAADLLGSALHGRPSPASRWGDGLPILPQLGEGLAPRVP